MTWILVIIQLCIPGKFSEAFLDTCIAVFIAMLKIDSAKKLYKKLLGNAARSASQCTNVENERGEVLICLNWKAFAGSHCNS